MFEMMGRFAKALVPPAAPYFTDTIAGFILLVVLAGPVYLACILGYRAWSNARIRKTIVQSEPIDARKFLAQWKTLRFDKKIVAGYKTQDGPGCYVIMTEPTPDGGYGDIYIGQSIHVCSRIRQHLTGHGNGDIYADYREGKNVQVRIVPCEKAELNAKEKELIAAFGATKSYNRTRGGGAVRA